MHILATLGILFFLFMTNLGRKFLVFSLCVVLLLGASIEAFNWYENTYHPLCLDSDNVCHYME